MIRLLRDSEETRIHERLPALLREPGRFFAKHRGDRASRPTGHLRGGLWLLRNALVISAQLYWRMYSPA